MGIVNLYQIYFLMKIPGLATIKVLISVLRLYITLLFSTSLSLATAHTQLK